MRGDVNFLNHYFKLIRCAVYQYATFGGFFYMHCQSYTGIWNTNQRISDCAINLFRSFLW